eukprot:m.57480 g.57480  ORF g.57480 m.57480 type:complete len:356 (-) comp11111_c0_seq1:3038-4105(-)
MWFGPHTEKPRECDLCQKTLQILKPHGTWNETTERTQLEEMVKLKGFNVDTPLCNGSNLLHTASGNGRREIVAFLINTMGANVNFQHLNSAETSLFAAAEAGHTQIVLDLLRAGASPHIKRAIINWTPLVAALSENRRATAYVLLLKGSSPFLQDEDGELADEDDQPLDIVADTADLLSLWLLWAFLRPYNGKELVYEELLDRVLEHIDEDADNQNIQDWVKEMKKGACIWTPLHAAAAGRFSNAAIYMLNQGYCQVPPKPQELVNLATSNHAYEGAPSIEICQKTVTLMKSLTQPWRRKYHGLYSIKFQNTVFTLLLVEKRLSKHTYESKRRPLPRLPHEIWEMFYSFLQRDWW